MSQEAIIMAPGHEHDDTFAEALGNFTIDRVKNRLKRAKHIIDSNDFADCPAMGIRDAWEALLEIHETTAAGLCILVERRGSRHPRTFTDWAWGLADHAPLATALIFLSIVLLKINGLDVKDLF